MANVLTGLIPTLYSSAIKTAREMTGFIPASKINFDTKQAAVNQTIRVPISPAQAAADYSPAAYAATGSDRTNTYVDVSITKNRVSSFHLTGEEERALTSGGNDIAMDTFEQSVAQAMRTLVNEIETDGGLAVYKGGSRAYGTAGTTPFGSNFNEIAHVRKILDDNGAPVEDRSLVIGTAAGVNLRSLTQLTKANEAGSDDLVRRGVLLDIHGFAIRESAKIASHTKGTGSGYLVNDATGLAIGDKTVVVDTGSNTILAGDVVTFNGDTNKYIVGTALASSQFALNNPGVLTAIADNTAITVGNSYTANCAFHRDAVVLVARPPQIDPTPVIETMMVSDPKTGLPFLVCRCLQDGQITYRVHLCWGWKVTQPEYVAVLLG